MLLFGVVLPQKLLWYPFFFKNPFASLSWNTGSINGKRYLEMSRDNMIPFLLEYNVLEMVIFMQGGEPL